MRENEGRRKITPPLKKIFLFQQVGRFGDFHDGIIAFLDDPQDRSHGGSRFMSEKFRRRYFTGVVRIFKMFLARSHRFFWADESMLEQKLSRRK